MNADASVPTVAAGLAAGLATLCGLVAFVIVVVWLVRRLDARPAAPPPPEPVSPTPVPDAAGGPGFFVAANAWFAIGLTLLVGGWEVGSESYSLFGHGRIEEEVYWVTTAVVFVAAGYSLRRWVRAAADPAAPDDGRPPAPYFAFAQAWFVVGLLLLLGMQYRGEWSYRLFGAGRIAKPVYWGVLAGVVGAGGFSLLRWRRTGTPGGPTAGQDLARLGLAGWVLIGVAGGWVLAKDRHASPEDVLYVGGPAVLVFAVVAFNLVRLAFGRRAGVRANRPRAMRAAAPTAGLVMLGVAAAGLAMVMLLGGAFGGDVDRGAWVLCLVAVGILGAIVLLVGLAARPRPPAPPPATVPPPPARDCPGCGRPVPPGSPQGLCPRCLLKGAMPAADRPSPTLAFVEALVAPPVEDVARLLPHLEVTELIGQGGMGAVYLARQTALDRPVALKLIRPRDNDPTFAERFAREARALAKLAHPGIVTVHESGTAGGLPYLVMEYVDGVTLRDAMREKKLESGAALAVVRQLCDALEYAHAQGVVHRDVKPENVLLTRDGRVKIADFGLAKVADPAGVSLTGTRQAMGTPHYMAPEQWEKPAEVDHRADIYALGVVLYELLTGELPLGRFDPPSQKVRLDVRLDEVVLRALAKEPDRRYQRASHVRTDIDRIDAGPGG